jgi:hypothetical protein
LGFFYQPPFELFDGSTWSKTIVFPECLWKQFAGLYVSLNHEVDRRTLLSGILPDRLDGAPDIHSSSILTALDLFGKQL